MDMVGTGNWLDIIEVAIEVAAIIPDRPCGAGEDSRDAVRCAKASEAGVFRGLSTYLKFTGRRSGLRAWRGLPDGVGRASTVARDRTRTRRLRARGQRRKALRISGSVGIAGSPGQARVSAFLSG